jgi:hypothetical protein
MLIVGVIVGVMLTVGVVVGDGVMVGVNVEDGVIEMVGVWVIVMVGVFVMDGVGVLVFVGVTEGDTGIKGVKAGTTLSRLPLAIDPCLIMFCKERDLFKNLTLSLCKSLLLGGLGI